MEVSQRQKIKQVKLSTSGASTRSSSEADSTSASTSPSTIHEDVASLDTRPDLFQRKEALPDHQQQLQLHGPRQDFQLMTKEPLPQRKSEREVLLRVQSIGLNPVDWKGPAFNFGLPSFPCVLGRDLAGTVVGASPQTSRLAIGDLVLAVSTDYRDYRKAAFQEYAIASDFNICRVPRHMPASAAAALGVAFVTAALTLGVSLGLRPLPTADGIETPDLWAVTRSLSRQEIPEDIIVECLDSMQEPERLQAGDWLAIWGASSTVGFVMLQLAKRAGVKVVCIADATKHGARLVDAGADLLVHRANTDEAIDITRACTRGNLRFGVDTVGKETAGWLQETLSTTATSSSTSRQNSHLVGLTGLPPASREDVVHHQVPVKLFHESALIGQTLVEWLEALLQHDALVLPQVDISDHCGLGGINSALERLRDGAILGQRMVVPV